MPRSRGYLRISLIVILALGLAGGVTAMFWGKHKANASSEARETPAEAEDNAITVKAVKPRYDKHFAMEVRRPADVEPYYWTDLESRVAGTVAWIQKDIGSEVKKGEVLVKLDVPDLVQTVKEKENFVLECKSGLDLAKANVETAEATVETAEQVVELKKTDVLTARATLVKAKSYYARIKILDERGTIDKGVYDEALRARDAAEAQLEAATLYVKKAEAEVKDARAKLKASKANVKVKASLVEVANSDLEYAKAKLGFAEIKAPYDGVIVHRYVNLGSFVQNASNGQRGTPILSVLQGDIVVVSMRVPDKFAPYITAGPDGTRAIIESDALPGVKIEGRVTRTAKSMINQEHDRTMPVQVELWNLPKDQFKKWADAMQARYVALKAEGKEKDFWDLRMGSYDPQTGKVLVCVPDVKGRPPAGQKVELLPGSFVRMTLVLRTFGESYLIPSSAIITRGGFPYIYVAQKGKAHLVPVHVQFDNGKLAKVERLNADREMLGDLTGQEEVLVSNLGELDEGTPVKVTVVNE